VRRTIPLAIWIAAALAMGCLGAGSPGPSKESSMPDRPIEDVLRAHTPELMSIPGVVGTAQGALPSGAPCIQVLVVRRTREIERRVPKSLEGWPVTLVITGEIRALSDSTW